MENDRTLNAHRSCESCAKNPSCWAYHEMLDITNRWPAAGFIGAGAPGWRGDVFIAFAHSCLLFEFKKLNKSNG